MISLEFRADALTEQAQTEMARHLHELNERWGVTFHEPGRIGAVPLDEVLVINHFPQLLCRFPHATIQPS